ncbi:MAG TPA: Crp/Fnr family transcriptional regulator [Streptosporangiaceae bacterium]|nr:Crp/Fnr family transcriptional regulator [Streptosporangiaceae bacterium]
MTTQEMSVLRAQPFLHGLPTPQLAELAQLCRHVVVPAGTSLFEEGSPANRFWLIDAGQVTLDALVPGRGRVVIDRLGRNDVLGLSWMQPPYQWRFGAVTTQPMQAFEFDARAVRAACDVDPVLGFELTRRFSAVLLRRLQATRARLLTASQPGPSSDPDTPTRQPH